MIDRRVLPDPYLQKTLDGHVFKRLRNESVEQVREELAAGAYDGIAFSPYGPDFQTVNEGWKGDINAFLSAGLKAKIVRIAYADRMGFRLESLAHVEGIEQLMLGDFSGRCTLSLPLIKDMSVGLSDGLDLGELPNLKNAQLYQPRAKHLKQLALSAPGLQQLAIFDSPVADIAEIANLTRLSSIELGSLKKLKRIAALAQIAALKEIVIDTARSISDLNQTLHACRGLEKVTLVKTPPLRSWEWIETQNLKSLICLEMSFPHSRHPRMADISHVDLTRSVIKEMVRTLVE
ncbi:MAG: hypothetical protein Q7P63_14725 [Verrucomicrobiota bacterium JB022]|nr:hypothetical protein [Verrucomicrobiota bacterium JB022]